MRLERRSIYTIHQGGGAEWAAGGPRQGARSERGERRRRGQHGGGEAPRARGRRLGERAPEPPPRRASPGSSGLDLPSLLGLPAMSRQARFEGRLRAAWAYPSASAGCPRSVGVPQHLAQANLRGKQPDLRGKQRDLREGCSIRRSIQPPGNPTCTRERFSWVVGGGVI